VSERDIGRHEEAIGSLKAEVHALRVEVSKMSDILSTAKGGWRTLLAVGGIAGTVGAAVMKFVALLKGGV
jgi:hypothetical protein